MKIEDPDEVVRYLHVKSELPEPVERRRRRLKHDLSQRQMGLLVGVSQQTIGLWETTDRVPRGDLLPKYVEILKTLEEIG